MQLTNCIDCVAMVEVGKQKQCRANPPQATMVMTQGFGGQPQPAVITFYPEVVDEYSCCKGAPRQPSKILS
jgi:hypothetical protein